MAVHLRERLSRLGLPDPLIAPVAAALAEEVACLVPAEGGTAILRPARFFRESEEELYGCLWYGNGRLLTFRRTVEERKLCYEFCRDNISSLAQARSIAEEIFGEVFSPDRGLAKLSPGLCSRLHVERSGMPSQDFEGEAITPELLEQLFQEFEKKWITRLVVTTSGPALEPAQLCDRLGTGHLRPAALPGCLPGLGRPAVRLGELLLCRGR